MGSCRGRFGMGGQGQTCSLQPFSTGRMCCAAAAPAAGKVMLRKATCAKARGTEGGYKVSMKERALFNPQATSFVPWYHIPLPDAR